MTKKENAPLLSGKMRITEIASVVGHSNSQYFIRKFKLKFGITPKQFQRSLS
ncbi:MAG TPA: AraC family transcriptional regulator [Clostridiales bacterium]|nr:AraC family transcriptional regulator [Clostridiales bacterium]